MSIAILLQQILIIFLEIGTGAAVTKLGIMDDRNSKFLSNLVMSVTLPCTLLASASIDGGREAVAGMLKGYLVLEIFYILTIGICLVLSRAMHLTRGQKAVPFKMVQSRSVLFDVSTIRLRSSPRMI